MHTDFMESVRYDVTNINALLLLLTEGMAEDADEAQGNPIGCTLFSEKFRSYYYPALSILEEKVIELQKRLDQEARGGAPV